MKKFLVVLCLALLPVFAFADETPAPAPTDTPAVTAPATADTPAPAAEEPKAPDVSVVDKDVNKHIEKTIEAWELKNWGVAVGLSIMLLVWFLVSFLWTTFPPAVLPWLASGLGMASAVAFDLVAGKPWWKSLLSGLTMGAAASGFWSMLGKYILERIKKPGHKKG